jgi:hypothetical protein
MPGGKGRRLLLQEHAVNAFHEIRFLWHDLRQFVFALAIAREPLAGEGDLAELERYRIERDVHAGASI